jgi:hypothetical protein
VKKLYIFFAHYRFCDSLLSSFFFLQKGGRPKDFVWSFFTGDREKATCNYCEYATERPKAFRMREHVLQCKGISDDKKMGVRIVVEQRDEMRRQKQQENDDRLQKKRKFLDPGAG